MSLPSPPRDEDDFGLGDDCPPSPGDSSWLGTAFSSDVSASVTRISTTDATTGTPAKTGRRPGRAFGSSSSDPATDSFDRERQQLVSNLQMALLHGAQQLSHPQRHRSARQQQAATAAKPTQAKRIDKGDNSNQKNSTMPSVGRPSPFQPHLSYRPAFRVI